MKSNIKNKIIKSRKTHVNLTIDVKLLDSLNNYKKKHGISMLSPMINEMLWEWLKEEGEENG